MRRPFSGTFYGWHITAAGAASSFLILSVAGYGFGVFIQQFRQEFGWSLQAISLGFSIRSVQSGLLAPFTGVLVDKLGPRKMAVLGAIIVSGSLLLMSQTHNLLTFYASSLLTALGMSLGGWSAFNVALMTWFRKKRGLALGFMSIGIGFAYFGALITGTMTGWFGWRETLIIFSTSILIVGVPLALVIRNKPEDMGYRQDGEKVDPNVATLTAGATQQVESKSGMTLKQAVRLPAFYLLALGQASGAAGLSAFIIFQIPHLQTAGFSLRMIGVFAAIYGLAQIPWRFGAGWVGDRIGRKKVYAAGFVLMAVGLTAMAFATPSTIWLMPVVLVVFGIGNAANLLGQSTTAADYFGTRQYATITGAVQTLVLPVAIGIPLFVGTVFDATGSYRNAYLTLAAASLGGTVWLLLIRRSVWNTTKGLPPAGEAPVL